MTVLWKIARVWTIALALASPAFGQNTPTAATYEAQAITASDDFAKAQTSAAKYSAASRAALAYANAERYGQAQLWLRISANHAKTLEQANSTRDFYLRVAAQNPFNVQLNFSIAPSDNINGGVDEEEFFLGPFRLLFAPEARALSGFEYSGSADLSYRIFQNQTHRTALIASLYGESFTLSGEAQRTVPDTMGRDFSFAEASLGLRHDAKLIDRWGVSSAELSFGRVWSAGQLQRQFTRLDLTQSLPAPPTWEASAGIGLEHETAIDLTQPDAMRYSLRADFAKTRANNDVLRLSLGASLYDAEIETFHHTNASFDVSYWLAKPILGTNFTFRAGLARKDYDEYSLSLDGRRDRTLTLGVTAVFNKLNAFGFSPSLTLSGYRTDSNVARFDTQGVSARIGLSSNF